MYPFVREVSKKNGDFMKEEICSLIKIFKLCIIYSILIAGGTALLLRTPFFAKQRVFLYRLIIFDILCCAALIIINFIDCMRNEACCGGIKFSTRILCAGFSTVFMALFFSLGLMSIERSYTVYSLADMAEHADKIYSTKDIEQQFINGYVLGTDASKKRITEQLYIGNLEEIDGGYRITKKGKNLIGFFRFIEKIFPVPDKSSIYPIY